MHDHARRKIEAAQNLFQIVLQDLDLDDCTVFQGAVHLYLAFDLK